MVTVKLFGVVGLDHLGGGGGGVLDTNSFLSDETLFKTSPFGSFLLERLSVLGLAGLSFKTGVEGSACLKVLIRGFKLRTKSASGLEAAEAGGL